jgi:hypothetical protein
MAKNVQNSHFSFARIFILAESTQLRSSPLHEAAERYKSVASEKNSVEITRFEIKKFTKILAES